jgi:cysteinyl-tRNA synthetase
VLNKALDEVRKIHEFVIELNQFTESGHYESDAINHCKAFMLEELANDFNSAGAMGHFFNLMKEMRFHKNELSSHSLVAARDCIHFIQASLGLVAANPEQVLTDLDRVLKDTSELKISTEEIEELILQRKTAKSLKNWAQADEIRKLLTKHKIELKDHPDGSTTWNVTH